MNLMTSTPETVNAKITSTALGPESHGIFSAYLHLDYGGAGQAFGGYALDSWDEAKKERIGTAYGAEFVRRVLATVGVEKWESLTGKHIRVKRTFEKVHAIGHIIEDRWFEPEKDLAHFFPASLK